ncbi:hypothetical protein TNCV_4857991 [Trichonephila clavipes]|nr:hypothetical protein TNCV_4857991 [Trichonephila clavipes]
MRRNGAVGSLVVRALDSRLERLGSMLVPPNTLRVHTEYVLVKSMGLKVLWVITAETMGAGVWRIFPSPPVSCLNCGSGDRCCHHLSCISSNCLRLWQLSFLRSGSDTTTTSTSDETALSLSIAVRYSSLKVLSKSSKASESPFINLIFIVANC